VERTILLSIYKFSTDLKTILLDYQNNYVGNSNMMSNVAKNFDILAISLSALF